MRRAKAVITETKKQLAISYLSEYQRDMRRCYGWRVAQKTFCVLLYLFEVFFH